MPRPEYVLDTINPRLTLQTVARLLACYALLQALGIAWGGEHRWAGSAALQVALAMPWAPYSWAVALALAGLLTAVATWARRPGVVGFGLVLIGVWHAFFAYTLARTLAHPVPTTGPPAYGLIALLCWLIAALYLASPRRRGRIR